MYLSTSLVAFVGLLSQILAAPNPVEIQERALKNNCNRDNLFRSFIDPRYSSSASAFCSTYVRQTVQATVTATNPGPHNRCHHCCRHGDSDGDARHLLSLISHR
ncbi:MAG: hypothetical protein Q9174_003635 [Haloplaca sp. 1 TL-2023]